MVWTRSRIRLRKILGASAIAVIAAATMAGCDDPAPALPVTFSDRPLAGDRLDGEGLAVLQVGATVYVGGIFTSARNQAGAVVATRSNLAAFDVTTGRLLNTFRADTNGPVRALATDGQRLFVGGSFTSVNGTARSRVAALGLVSGAVDPAFLANTNSNVYGLAQAGGRLVIGGSFSRASGVARSRVAVVSTVSGSPLAAAPVFDATVNSVGVTSDGARLIAGGSFTHVNGADQRWAAIVNVDTGALAPTQLSPVEGPLLAIAISAGDQFLSASMGATNSGNRYRLSDGHRLWLQRCDGDGQAIEDFQGTVYTGFHEACAGDNTIRLTANDATTGQRDLTYKPTFDRFWGIRSIDATPDALLVAGDFTSISGVAAQGFAIFPPQGTPPPPPTTTTTATTTAPPPTTTAPAPTTTVAAPPSNGFPITLGSTWRYSDGLVIPPASWKDPTFADGAWPSGRAQLGYGDGDEATVLSRGIPAAPQPITTYFRRSFTLGAVPGALSVGLVADDGAVVYLNGVEVVRDNMNPGPVTPSTLAAANRCCNGENQVRTFTVAGSAANVGTNVIAVEVHQDYAKSSDLSFDLALAPA